MTRRQKAELPPELERGTRRVRELVPYAQNSRTHTAQQVEKIADSMRRFGVTFGPLVDENGTIIAGHARVMAAELAGYGEIPVTIARGWSEEMIRAYVIADNRLAEEAGWDDELLRAEIEALSASGFDLSATGFEDGELEAILAGEEEADEEKPEDDTPDEVCSRCGRTIVPDKDLTRRARKKRKARSTTITAGSGADSHKTEGDA